MGISYHGPLTPQERELLRPRPPEPPWHVKAARNLHRYAQAFAEAEIDERAATVSVRRDGWHLVLTATEEGWHCRPPVAELEVPLDKTAPMGRHLRRLLTESTPPGEHWREA
jgi:hypothetical protein